MGTLTLKTSTHAGEASDTYGLSPKDEAWAQANRKTPPSTDTELEMLAEAALVADMNAKEAVALQASTKAAFKEALAKSGRLNGDTKAIGVVRTIIKKTRRFDPSLAKQLLTAEEVAKYSDISGALVKANVAPAVYEMFQADTGYSLEVKVDAA